jgi:hypothetical protein
MNSWRSCRRILIRVFAIPVDPRYAGRTRVLEDEMELRGPLRSIANMLGSEVDRDRTAVEGAKDLFQNQSSLDPCVVLAMEKDGDGDGPAGPTKACGGSFVVSAVLSGIRVFGSGSPASPGSVEARGWLKLGICQLIPPPPMLAMWPSSHSISWVVDRSGKYTELNVETESWRLVRLSFSMSEKGVDGMRPW